MPTVILIEDDADIRATLRLALEEVGYPVIEAEDGEEGLRLLRAHSSPVIALVDHLLPAMTSEEILRRVARQDELALARHVYIITTASPQVLSPAYQELLAGLETPIIAKPFDLDLLLETVEAQAARLRERGEERCPRSRVTPPLGR